MPQSKLTPQSAAEWATVLPRYIGMVGAVFCSTVWLVTDRLEPLLLSFFGTLIMGSYAADAIRALKQGPPPPPDLGEGSGDA